ncbi:VOC family protein [Caulobacter sp. NIBR2454]|uniref:VOC family protein n=1 Tax=Caulobacter sp. NIBR2454 TaxID=3015996 RepID=UPI0022B72EFF|nr:glyoxalase/bleomycin resistance/extradiol dioxygenase family protein [Caulobacter sp. NIBR2454]
MTDSAQAQAMPAVEVKGGVVAYLCVEGAAKAAEFYARAFGATVAAQYPPDENGRTMHIHLYVNGSSLMLSDPFPEHGAPYQPLQGATLMLPATDIEKQFKRAIDAGAVAKMEPQKMFWGDTYGEFVDPFGVSWSMNQQA